MTMGQIPTVDILLPVCHETGLAFKIQNSDIAEAKETF